MGLPLTLGLIKAGLVICIPCFAKLKTCLWPLNMTSISLTDCLFPWHKAVFIAVGSCCKGFFAGPVTHSCAFPLSSRKVSLPLSLVLFLVPTKVVVEVLISGPPEVQNCVILFLEEFSLMKIKCVGEIRNECLIPEYRGRCSGCPRFLWGRRHPRSGISSSGNQVPTLSIHIKSSSPEDFLAHYEEGAYLCNAVLQHTS